MKLQELEPELLRLVSKDAWMAISDTILSDKVSGIRFRCPHCFDQLGSLDKVNFIYCWKPHVSPKAFPSLGRYEFTGKFIHDFTFSGPISCKTCHSIFFIEKGIIRILVED